MNFFLIGFMGSGKTKTGKILAKKMQSSFIDTDAEISTLLNKSIPEIFKEKGELYFRQHEQLWLSQFKSDNAIISTGGGMPCYNDNIEIMKQKGTVIYLKFDPSILTERLLTSSHERPLIIGLSSTNLSLTVAEMLNKRSPYYEKAHITLNLHKFSYAKNVAEIIAHKIENLAPLIS